MSRALLLDINSMAFSAYPKRHERLFKSRKLLTTTLIQNIVSIQEQYKCDIIIAAFDGGSAFRKNIYPEYKAKRAAADPQIIEFKKQIVAEREIQQELFTALGIPWIYMDGLEGDDIISLLVKHYTEAVIISRDSDLKQLITPTICVYDQVSKVECNAANFQSVYQYPVSEHVHAKALLGDVADNIKGIPGIGPAAVQSLYQKYGTLVYESLLEHAAELQKSKVTAKLFDSSLVTDYLAGRIVIDLSVTNQLLLNEMPSLLDHLIALINSFSLTPSISTVLNLAREYDMYVLHTLNLRLYKKQVAFSY